MLAHAQIWRSDVLAGAPWFSPLMPWHAELSAMTDWPSHHWLNEQAKLTKLQNAQGLPIRFVLQEEPIKALPYERQIYAQGLVPTRLANWHDLFNALCWLRFPLSKAVLNALHAESDDSVSSRGRQRDALTLFDECGMLIEVSDAAWMNRLKAHDWLGVWWTDRVLADAEIRYTLYGHSEFEKGMAPFRGWTAKAFFLPMGTQETLDARLASALQAGTLIEPRQLSPLPVLGVPGWQPGQCAAFYQDTGYFRPARASQSSPQLHLP